MNLNYSDGLPRKERTPEEIEQLKTERLEKKLASRRRKGFEIPRHQKQGMSREKQFQKEWNNYGKREKKKHNIKGRLDLNDKINGSEKNNDTEKSATRPRVTVRRNNRPANKRTDRSKDFSNTAKRTPNSGATWHTKGDVKLSHALVEVKERGTVNGRGEKTISIPKEWLTTQAEEAFSERRDHWYLAFAYKGDKEIYVIKPYDHELEIVHEHEDLLKKYKELEEKYNKLKEGDWYITSKEWIPAN